MGRVEVMGSFKTWSRLHQVGFVAFVLAMAMLTPSCSRPGTATETRIQIERVPVRAPCPDPTERKRLADLRPKPLRDQPMPATADERVAKQAAQLGRYEAKGAWGDQVDAALDRCQKGEDLTPSP